MKKEIDQGLNKGDKTYFLLWGVAFLTFLIWHIPFIRFIQYPFFLLGTWFHEMGHGLTALIMGGHFEKLEIFANGSGVAHSRIEELWINQKIGKALISLGGLLGPAIAGGIMILSGRQKKWSSISLVILGVVMLLSVGIWIRTIWGIIIIGTLGLFLLYVSRKWSKRKQQLLIQFLGIQASLSTFLQIGYLFKEKAVIGGKEIYSDTANIAMNTFGNYFLWGIIISILTIGLIWYCFRLATKDKLLIEKKSG